MTSPGNQNSSRLPPNSSPAQDGPSYRTALKGASLAFQRTTPRPSPNTSPATSSRNINNGALIAATSASRDHSVSRSPSQAKHSRLSRQTTGNSVQDGNHGHELESGAVSQRLAQHLNAGQNHGAPFLAPPGGRPGMPDPRTQSFIAATLAASRSGSPSPNQPPHAHPYAQQPTPRFRRRGSGGGHSAASSVTSLDLADTASIAPTNALISMFEKTSKDTDPVKKELFPTGTIRTTAAKPRLRPMTPPRTLSPVTKHDVSPSRLASTLAWDRATSPPASIPDVRSDGPRSPSRLEVETKIRPPTPPPARKTRPDTIKEGRDTSYTAPQRRPRAATPPRPISQAETVILSPQPRRTASQRIIPPDEPVRNPLDAASKKPPPPVKPKPRPRSMHGAPSQAAPLPAKPRRPELPPRRSPSTSSNDTFVSASSARSPAPGSPSQPQSRSASPGPVPPRRPASAQSLPGRSFRPQPVPPPLRRAQASNSSVNLPLTSLANATMAGILASSRASPSSLSSPPPRPPSRRQTPHMRQTLRRPASKSDDEESTRASKHRKKPLSSGKKHAHHEGARRRWREEITARERKRYEGLWASNRGVLVPSAEGPHAGELVVNVVVRDIWSRSRLPIDELAEVWDLVDRHGTGMLDRAAFVVGMWLIDQRLRGRKIPRKVSDSVWGSAKGVKVLGPKGKRH